MVRKENVRRGKKRLRKRVKAFCNSELSAERLECSINSWMGHLQFGESKKLQYQIFSYLCFEKGINLFKGRSGSSWRVLEQQYK